MKKLAPFCLLLFLALDLNGQKKLVADTEKSTLNWRGERVMSQHEGTISLKSGWITLENDRIINGEFIIDMQTIEESNDVQKLEAHLRSDDFFSVEKYPEARFVITESTPFEKGIATVKGMLTIKGNTHPVEFKTVMQQKDDGIWFFSKVIFDRSDYDVRFGSGKFYENLGDRLIYDDIELRAGILAKES